MHHKKLEMIAKRIVLISLGAAFLFVTGCATMPPRAGRIDLISSQTIKIGGKDYLPASTVARYYEMNWEWDSIARRAKLVKGDTAFVFNIGMDYALINGRPERLSSPAVFYKGAVAIPYDFVLQKVGKILGTPQVVGRFPQTTAQRYVVRKIVLDPGHGGEDPGAIGVNGLREKDVVLDISKQVRDQLNNYGIDVILTRDRDRFISLSRRTAIANANDADFFISIHANSSRLKGVKGFEVYYLSNAVDDNARAVEAAENSFLKFDEESFYFRNSALEATLWDLVYTENRQESIELARYITKAVDDSMSIKSRGIKSARFYVLKGTQMPAVLIETGFISNAAEGKNLRDPAYRAAVAAAIAKGILNYKRVYEATDGFTR